MSVDAPEANSIDETIVHDPALGDESDAASDAAPSGEEGGVAGEKWTKKIARLPRKIAQLPRKAVSWIKKNRVRAAAIGLFVIVSVLSGMALTLIVGREHSNQESIAKAMAYIEEENLRDARAIAKSIAEQTRRTPRDLADSAFIYGMAAADDAKAGWPDNKSSYLLAAHYFDIAYPIGFPEDYELAGLEVYGDVLLHCHRFGESQKVLEEALDIAKTAEEKNEVRYLLVETDLAAENPDLTEMTRLNDAYLASGELSEEERINGTLQKVQILTREGKFKKAHSLLDAIPLTPAYSEKVYYARGRLNMREAVAAMAKGDDTPEQQIRQKLEKEAIVNFRRAQGNAGESSPIIPRSKYMIGLCFEQLKDNRAAIRQWEEVCELYPDAPEAIGSQYRLGELFFEKEASQEVPVKAIKYFKQVADALEKDGYTNPWVTAAEIRTNASDRIKAFRKEEKFEAALALTQAVAPLMSKLEALQLLADLHRSLARQILEHIPSDVANKAAQQKRSEARRHFREASLLYGAIAKLETTSEHYFDDLWLSAECALEGNDFFRAGHEFVNYLNRVTENRYAGALLGLGKAYLSLGKVDEAIDTFEQCIEFYPLDLAAFQARLFAAEAWLEKGKPEPAEQLLLENWSAAGITPASLVWRETLYRLGELYHDTGQYDKAIERLEDAVRRFPDDPRTNVARYLLADSYRLRADAAQQRIEKTMTRSKLSAQKANLNADLQAAFRQYTLLQQHIGSQRGMAALTEMDSRLLRNSRILAAGVLLELHQYEQASKAYSTASLHYQGQPISIQAMQQNALALSELGRNREAQNLLRRTLSQLDKMGPNLPYQETTLYSFEEWKQLLGQMEQEIAMKQDKP